jgi:hypothetical protein
LALGCRFVILSQYCFISRLIINTTVLRFFSKLFAGFYLLAKVLEATDDVVYKWTYHIVSGHTLKHLFAAMVPVFLTFMLAKRSLEQERYMPVPSSKLHMIDGLNYNRV